MIQYKLLEFSSTIVKNDSGVISSIPSDDGNADWLRYQSWLLDGNEPLAADADWE